ncbi:uncharacterized protein RBU47_011836 [Passerculus sandwichensis]
MRRHFRRAVGDVRAAMMAAPRVSLGALKEPLGLSRGLQWFFSIFAFATCGGFEGSVTFSVTCPGGDNATQVTNVTATYGYPFRLNQAVFQPSLTLLCNRTWPRDVHLVGDFSSAARFFVGVAVGAFLYSLGALGLYLGYLHRYRCAGSRLPLMVSDSSPVQVLGALGLYLGYLRLYRCAGSRLPLMGVSYLYRCELPVLGLYLGYLHRYRCAGSRLPLMDLLLSALLSDLLLSALLSDLLLSALLSDLLLSALLSVLWLCAHFFPDLLLSVLLSDLLLSALLSVLWLCARFFPVFSPDLLLSALLSRFCPFSPQDLLFSALLSVLWLCASCAWAQGLGHVREAANAPLPHCPAPSGDVTCARAAATPMGGLGASVAFGFLNLLLWAGGSWFVYKETPLHRPAPPPEPSPAPM